MEKLNENYSKDKLNIYFDWKSIEWVDLKSFKIISDIFVWLLWIITLLYNPFWIIHLWRELWEVVYIITIIIYFIFIYNIKD